MQNENKKADNPGPATSPVSFAPESQQIPHPTINMASPPNTSAPFPAPSSTSPSDSYHGLTSSGAAALSKTQNRKTKIILSIAIFLVLIVLGLAGWFGRGAIAGLADRKYTSTTYDNGKGSVFKLKFYKGGTRKPASELSSLGSAGSSSTYYLVAPDTLGKNVNLAMYITKTGGYKNLEGCKKPAFSVIAKMDQESEPVCIIAGTADKPITYIFQFTKGPTAYLAVILLDYDQAKATSDRDFAQEIVKNVNLNNYNDSLKPVLSSITVQ
jgi:hypothetical protein